MFRLLTLLVAVFSFYLLPAWSHASTLASDLSRSLGESRRVASLALSKSRNGQPASTEMFRLSALRDELAALRLLHSEQSSSIVSRASSIGGNALERQQAVTSTLSPVLDDLIVKLDAAIKSGTTDDLQQLLDIINRLSPSRPRPLLGTLPYKHSGYSPREPATAPLVVPAYKGGDRAVHPADTAASAEAPLTREIVELAQSLQWNPVLIYEWVKNNVETEWYWGSMKGAEETLRQKSGNDADQASLLVALLRAANFPARYVRGTIDFFPGIEHAKNLTGLDDPIRIADFLRKAGIPFKPVISGGGIANFQIEHIWVEAFIPYANYRGAVLDEQGKLWLGLDTSIKPRGYSRGQGGGVPADLLATLRDDYLKVIRTLTPLEYLAAKLDEQLAESQPGKSWSDLRDTAVLIPDVLKIIPDSMQFNQIAITGEYQALPEELKHKLTITATAGGNELFSITQDTHKLSNRRLALRAEPETVEDQNTIDSFGGLDNTPAYLVRLRPVLTLDGERLIVARDGLPMGGNFTLNIDIITPNGTERISSSQVNGNLSIVGVVAQLSTKSTNDTKIVETDDAETILHKEAISYIDRWNRSEDDLAALLGQRISRPTVTIVTVGGQIEVAYLLDSPQDFQWKGLYLDAGYRRIETTGRNGLERDFMRLSSLQGSILENRIFEDDLKVDSVSTAKLLQLAGSGGTPVIVIDKAGIDAILPMLAFDDAVKADIVNAVNQGLTVTIPQTEIAYQDWSGIGYVKENPVTGEAGWMLSGQVAGGMTVWSPDKWDSAATQAMSDALRAPYGGKPNTDPLSAASIVKIPDTDQQVGTVGKLLKKALQVKVLDKQWHPVKGASVTFTVRAGGGSLGNSNDKNVTAKTNRNGIASVTLTLGKKTADNPSYWFTTGNTYSDQYGGNTVDAATSAGIAIIAPFAAYGKPDSPVQIEKLLGDGNRALPNNPAGSLLARVIDQYGNPVSNIPVSFVALPPVSRNPNAPFPANSRPVTFYRPTECTEAYPLYGNCPSILGLVATSDYIGAAVNTMMGDTVETDHSIQATAPGVPAVFYTLSSDGFRGKFGDYIPPGLYIRSLQLVNDKGQVIDAAKVGTPLAKPLVSELFMLYDDFTITPTGNLVLTGIVKTKPIKDGGVFYKTSGGSVSGTVNLNNGKYQATYTSGTPPALNTIEATGVADVSVPMVLYTNFMNSGTYNLPNFVRGTEPLLEYPGKLAITSYSGSQYTCEPKTGCRLREKVMTFQSGQQAVFFDMDDPAYHYIIGQPRPTTFSVFGVDITQTPGKVFLNKDGHSLNDLKFNYTISPPEYSAQIADVVLYKDSNAVVYVAGETKGAGSATLARGATFDMASMYASQVVLNNGSDAEIRSEKKVVTVVDTSQINIEIRDLNNQCNKAPRPPKEDDKKVTGQPDIDTLVLTTNTADKAYVLPVLVNSGGFTNQDFVWRIVGTTLTGTMASGAIEIFGSGIATTEGILEMGIDVDRNGIYDAGDIKVKQFNVVVIPSRVYSNASDVIYGGSWITNFKGGQVPLAASLLRTFVGEGGSAVIQPDNVNHNMKLYSTAHNLELIAGADFKPIDSNYDVCEAKIDEYIYSSQVVSDIIGDSNTIKAVYEGILENTKLVEGNNNPFELQKKPINGEFKTLDPTIILPPHLSDVHIAIGGHTMNSFAGNATVIKDSNSGKLCVVSIHFKGEIVDLYDWNYWDNTILSVFVRDAATLQLGWNSGLNGSSSEKGKLFFTKFIFEKTKDLYEYRLCY